MKMLIVSAVVCAMMVLTRAAAPPEETPQDEPAPPEETPQDEPAPPEETPQDEPAPPEETPQDEPESRPVKTGTDCPFEWSLLGGRCYHYSPIEMTWARAQRNCQDQGGNLASVHNTQQHFDIQRMIFENANRPSPTWIGGSDAQEENQWFWSDGTPFNYRHWCHGEPGNNKGNQHCLQMNHKANRCWDDEECSKQLPSLCVR